VIDASGVPADVLDHSYFAMSYEAVADMSLALAGVPTADRLTAMAAGSRPWSAAMSRTGLAARIRASRCGGQRPPPAAGSSRILVKLVPLIPFYPNDLDAFGPGDHQRLGDADVKGRAPPRR